MEHNAQLSKDTTSRSSFLRTGLVIGGARAISAGLLVNGLPAFAEERRGDLTQGDVAILRFLAVVEILESDLWQQYNAYLALQGANPVNLDTFRTLPSSIATGAQQIGRLTNLMQLTVDTNWWIRYSSCTQNPETGWRCKQVMPDAG